MRSTALFLATLLISVSMAMASKKTPAILAEIESHPFGKTLLNIVQIQFKMQHPIEDIASYLYDLLNQLQSAQATEDQEHSDFQSQCDTDLSTLNNTVSTYQQSLETAQDAYNAAVQVEQTKTAQLTNEQSDLADYQDELQVANDNNTQALASYQEAQANLSDAISACGDALDLLSRLGSGSSFIQLSSQVSKKLEKVKEKLAHHLMSSMAIYTPIIDALSQIKQNADPADVQAVSDLITKLQAELTDHLNNLNDNEENRESNYNTTVTNLNNNIDSSNARIAQLTQDISDAQAEEANEQSKIDSYGSLLQNAQDALALRQSQCQNNDANYQSDTETRDGELALLQKLIDSFESKLASMSDYLSQRVGNYSSDAGSF